MTTQTIDGSYRPIGGLTTASPVFSTNSPLASMDRRDLIQEWINVSIILEDEPEDAVARVLRTHIAWLESKTKVKSWIEANC